MHLSKNLTLKEVTKSHTASRLGIKNEPRKRELDNLREIGYRSPKLNTAIGGSPVSQHCQGRALDLDADVFGGVCNAEIFKYIKDNLDFDQLIWEMGTDLNPAWVHVSYVSDRENRKRIYKATQKGGVTVYSVW